MKGLRVIPGPTLICWRGASAHGAVVQWQNFCFPSRQRGFDSRQPLQCPRVRPQAVREGIRVVAVGTDPPAGGPTPPEAPRAAQRRVEGRWGRFPSAPPIARCAATGGAAIRSGHASVRRFRDCRRCPSAQRLPGSHSGLGPRRNTDLAGVNVRTRTSARRSRLHCVHARRTRIPNRWRRVNGRV